MKRLLLICGIAEVVLLIALSYVKILFPFGEENPVLINAALQILIKELILLPMILLVIAAKKSSIDKYLKTLLSAFVIIAAADAVIVLNMLGGLALFAVAWGVIGYSLTGEFIRKRIKFTAVSLFIGSFTFVSVLGVFMFFFDKPLAGQTLMWTVVFVYTLIMGYAVSAASITFRLGNFEFALSAVAGTVLFFICDCQVAYNEIVLKQNADVWSNNVIYYSGLFFLSLTAFFQIDKNCAVKNTEGET